MTSLWPFTRGHVEVREYSDLKLEQFYVILKIISYDVYDKYDDRCLLCLIEIRRMVNNKTSTSIGA